MTGKLDKRMRAAAQRLIDDFGKPTTLQRTSTTYDPGTGTTTETTTDYSVNGVLEAYSENRIDGTLVKVGDMRLTVPARDLAVTPDQTVDRVIIDGTQWSIVNIGRLYSGAQVATYEMQVRQ